MVTMAQHENSEDGHLSRDILGQVGQLGPSGPRRDAGSARILGREVQAMARHENGEDGHLSRDILGQVGQVGPLGLRRAGDQNGQHATTANEMANDRPWLRREPILWALSVLLSPHPNPLPEGEGMGCPCLGPGGAARVQRGGGVGG